MRAYFWAMKLVLLPLARVLCFIIIRYLSIVALCQTMLRLVTIYVNACINAYLQLWTELFTPKNKAVIPQILMEISCVFFHKWWNNGFERMCSDGHNNFFYFNVKIFNLGQNYWPSCLNNQLCNPYSWLLPLIIFEISVQDYCNITGIFLYSSFPIPSSSLKFKGFLFYFLLQIWP